MLGAATSFNGDSSKWDLSWVTTSTHVLRVTTSHAGDLQGGTYPGPVLHHCGWSELLLVVVYAVRQCGTPFEHGNCVEYRTCLLVMTQRKS